MTARGDAGAKRQPSRAQTQAQYEARARRWALSCIPPQGGMAAGRLCSPVGRYEPKTRRVVEGP